MTTPISFGNPELELVASMAGRKGVPDPETPFRILIMGDFGGRVSRGNLDSSSALSGHPPRLVDRDNFDEVMAKLGVEIRLPLNGAENPPVAIRFAELDDFHPDRLYAGLELFRTIRENRKNLADPVYFARSAGNGAAGERSAGYPPPRSADEAVLRVAGESSGSILDQMLEETEGGHTSDRGKPKSEWDNFLTRIVQPHLVPDMDAKQSEVLDMLDNATGDLMRAVLHYPDFQEVEASWRGLRFLVSRLETGEELEVYLLDLSKAELADDLGGAADPKKTGIYRLLVEETRVSGAVPWAVVAGLYTFDSSREDVELLSRIAQIAAAAGTPFIAAGSERILGCNSLAEAPAPAEWRSGSDEEALAWVALRRLSVASSLGLVLPRFLLRLPYGADTDPVDSFDFEEMPFAPEHDQYLWGNPAFACTTLVGQAFSAHGWEMKPGMVQDLEDLPLHIFREQGESRAKPCAETLLTYDAVDTILEWGLMPIVSFKDRDDIRLARFQSIADPPCALSGRWNAGR